jgi:Bacterial Ig-like domain
MTWRKPLACLFLLGTVVAIEGCNGFGTNCSTNADCQASNPEAVCDPTLKVCFIYGGPVVTSIVPANGASGVASDGTNVEATFSTSIVDSGVNASSFSVVGQGFVTPGDYLVTATTATYIPDAGGLALGTDYTVNLTAAIKDGQGNTLLPLTSTFSTRDGTWGSGGTLEFPTGDWAMASDYAGGLITGVDILIEGTFNDYGLLVGASLPGDAPILNHFLQNAVGSEVVSPSVAVANDGFGFVSWTSFPTDAGTPFAFTGRVAVYDAFAQTWGPAIQLGPSDPSVAQFPIVAAGGSAIAVWTENNGGTPLIFESHYDFLDAVWQDGGTVQTNFSLGGTNPSVSVDNDGNALIVWQSEQSGGGPTVILARYLSITGNNPPPVQVSNAAASSSTSPFVSLGITGFGAVVWPQQTGETDAGIPIVHVFASTFDPNANPNFSAPVQLDKAAIFATFPEVGVAANGNALAIWQELGAAVSSTYDYATKTWSAPFTLDSDTTFAVNGPTIVVDPGGNALATWVKNGATDGFQMYGGRYTADGGWHGQQRITVGADAVSDAYPALVVDSRGRGWALMPREPSSGSFYLQYVPFQ